MEKTTNKLEELKHKFVIARVDIADIENDLEEMFSEDHPYVQAVRKVWYTMEDVKYEKWEDSVQSQED